MLAPTTAAQRRAQLANAHAQYFNSHKNGDAALALFNALTLNNVVDAGCHLADVQMDSTTIVVTVDTETFRETVELDAYGNTIRGVGA